MRQLNEDESKAHREAIRTMIKEKYVQSIEIEIQYGLNPETGNPWDYFLSVDSSQPGEPINDLDISFSTDGNEPGLTISQHGARSYDRLENLKSLKIRVTK